MAKNWEYHIDLLEDAFYGKLYKTVISEEENRKSCSLSGINRGISIIVLVFWLYILLNMLRVNFGDNKLIVTVFAAFITLITLFGDDIKNDKNIKHINLYFDTRKIDSVKKNKPTFDCVFC